MCDDKLLAVGLGCFWLFMECYIGTFALGESKQGAEDEKLILVSIREKNLDRFFVSRPCKFANRGIRSKNGKS